MQIGNTIVTVDKKKAATIKWLIIGTCCVLAAPAALFILKGVIALAAAGLIAAGSIFFAPVVAQKMAVQRIKMEVKDAQENPIETLKSEYAQMQQDYNQFEAQVTQFGAEVANFAQQTNEFKREYPDDAKLFEEQLAAHQALQADKEEKFKQAGIDLKTFAGVVKRAEAMWRMAASSKRMSELAGKQAGDVFSQIRKETSLDTVRQATYESFSAVRTSLLKTASPIGHVSQGALPQPTADTMVPASLQTKDAARLQ